MKSKQQKRKRISSSEKTENRSNKKSFKYFPKDLNNLGAAVAQQGGKSPKALDPTRGEAEGKSIFTVRDRVVVGSKGDNLEVPPAAPPIF